jgi:hypothetical protein
MAAESVTLARDGGTPVAALEASLIAERYRVETELELVDSCAPLVGR